MKICQEAVENSVCVVLAAVIAGFFDAQIYAGTGKSADGEKPYVVVDVARGGAEARAEPPSCGWPEAARTEQMVLREVKAGTFIMGAEGKPGSLVNDESPAHRVTLTKDFLMGVFEVTRGQWLAVVGNLPDGGVDRLDEPVANVSQTECLAFLQRLSARCASFSFRLPTEAEWEFACRGGNAGSDGGRNAAAMWYLKNSGLEPHPVGLLAPNALGLHDMLGNVWEWCSDEDYVYSGHDQTDPSHAPKEMHRGLRIARGGGFRNAAEVCSPVRRGMFSADFSGCQWGFRVVAEKK